MVSGLRGPGALERRERELQRAPPVGQAGERVLARELHELRAVAAVGEQEVNEQCDDPDAGHHHHGIPAQLLCLAVRLLLRILELALEREVALDLPVGLESRAQRAGLTDALGVVRRGVALHILLQVGVGIAVIVKRRVRPRAPLVHRADKARGNVSAAVIEHVVHGREREHRRVRSPGRCAPAGPGSP